MSYLLIEDLHLYNSMIRGLQWWSRFNQQYPEYANSTYGAEGCKLRLKLAIRVKLLDYLLDEKLLEVAGTTVDDVIGQVSYLKEGKSCIELIFGQLRRGLEIMLCDARQRYFRPDQVSPWWPYCRYCPPKGYNCMISLSYDFLDTFCELKLVQKTVHAILSRLEQLAERQEEKVSPAWKHIMAFIKRLKAFESWSEKYVQKPLTEGILERRYYGKTIEEWILDEVNKNLKIWQKPKLIGWPVIMRGTHRKEQIEDPRGLLLNIISNNYTLHKEIRNKFLLIKKIETQLNLKDFIDSKAKLIDPLTTAFILKFLFLHVDRNLVNEYFSKLHETILGCIETIAYLYEGPIIRNTDSIELADEQRKIVIFDGKGFPKSDGAWMNFELTPDPSFPPPLPDYSLCSTLDIASTLIFLSTFYPQLDKSVTNLLENIVNAITNHIIQERLNQTRTAEEIVNRLDISHWADRYSTNCELSDIYGTIKMLDHLLNVALKSILNEDPKHASNLLFGIESFRENLFWLVNQQHKEGFWPCVSNDILKLALEDDSLGHVFSSFLDDLGLPRIVKGKYNIEQIIDKNRQKLISYANTIEAIALISKYFIIKILLGILH